MARAIKAVSDEPWVDARPTFPLARRHTMGRFRVFTWDAWGWFWLFVALYPVISFGIGIGLYLNGWWPYMMLQASICLLPLLPLLSWLIAAKRTVIEVPILRRVGNTAVLDRQPWFRPDAAQHLNNFTKTPAAIRAWWFKGKGNQLVPFIDALDDPAIGREFSVLEYDYDGATDTEVSLLASTIDSERLYSAKGRGDWAQTIKLVSVMLFIGGLLFANWFLLTSMAEKAAAGAQEVPASVAAR